jgi:hypothetical protein
VSRAKRAHWARVRYLGTRRFPGLGGAYLAHRERSAKTIYQIDLIWIADISAPARR